MRAQEYPSKYIEAKMWEHQSSYLALFLQAEKILTKALLAPKYLAKFVQEVELNGNCTPAKSCQICGSTRASCQICATVHKDPCQKSGSPQSILANLSLAVNFLGKICESTNMYLSCANFTSSKVSCQNFACKTKVQAAEYSRAFQNWAKWGRGGPDRFCHAEKIQYCFPLCPC